MRRIPIKISPFFWLMAALIGFLNSRSFFGTFIWVIVIFVSILVHEFGHALLSLLFGQNPSIELVAFGGVTFPSGKRLSRPKEFLVILGGPFFGFCLCILAYLFLMKGAIYPDFVHYFLGALFVVNYFWTLLNLLPILPLDGGHLVRVLCEGAFKAKGTRIVYFIGMVVSAAVCVAGFLWTQSIFVGILFFLFAFQNFEGYRRTKNTTAADLDNRLKEKILEGEKALLYHHKKQAEGLFKEVRERSQGGILHAIATQHLARLSLEQGDLKETYTLLFPLKDQLDDEGSIDLHKAAFEMKDYSTVDALSGGVYRMQPKVEVAIRNATAAAALKKVKPTIGWLDAALEEGKGKIQDLLCCPPFTDLQGDPIFDRYIQKFTKKEG